MKKSFWDLIKLCIPLRGEKKLALNSAGKYLNAEEVSTLRHFLKMDRTFPVMQRFHTSEKLFEDVQWPFFKSHLRDDQLHKFLEGVNDAITTQAKKEAFMTFAPVALERIGGYMAPNLVGLDALKRAASLQLFAKEPVHVLLLGDPGTGKTDILRSLHALAPKGSLGLGSGTSGAGLSAMAKGDTLLLGLLPLADGGIACIDELNLMKSKDMASLYNAMEKGFITYDKGSKHEQVPARVRVCATANPTGDTFIGKSAEILKKQIPFGDALLTRFHLIFLVRKPTEGEFEQIASHIIKHDLKAPPKEDVQFLREYVNHALALDVQLDSAMEQQILAKVKELKADERQFIAEIGPRTVVGAVRLVKAVARAELCTSVAQRHIDTAFSLLHSALYVRKEAA